MSKEKYLEIGKIVNIHGVRGALKVEPWCDSPEQLFSRDAILQEARRVYAAHSQNRFDTQKSRAHSF